MVALALGVRVVAGAENLRTAISVATGAIIALTAIHYSVGGALAFSDMLGGGVVFAAAGRLDLPFVWGLLGTLVGFFVILALTADPDLLRERVSPGGPNRDRLTRPLAVVFLVARRRKGGADK